MATTIAGNEFYEKALEIAHEKLPEDFAFSPESVQRYRSDLLQIASYHRMAIDKSNGRHNKAASKLSMIFIFIGEDKKARQYANMAIKQNPNDVEARFTHFMLACKELDEYNPYIDQGSIVGTLLTVGWAKSKQSGKKKTIFDMARNVGVAFNNNFHSNNPPSVDDLIYYAEWLFDVGDILHQYGLDTKEIYMRILKAPWEKFQTEELKEQIQDLKLRAQAFINL